MHILIVFGLIFGLAQSLPVQEEQPSAITQQTFVRPKRKLEKNENLDMKTIELDNDEDQVPVSRDKKQVRLVNMQPMNFKCDGKANCEPSEDISNEAPMTAAKTYSMIPMLATTDFETPKNAFKTADPIYNLGPMTVLGSGIRPQQTPSYALMPLSLLHQHPLLHHLLGRPQSGKVDQLVYDGPTAEPIYVINNSAGEENSKTLGSLFCRPVPEEKSIKPTKPNKTATGDRADDDHAQRVNEIKEEIMELTKAARRIVQQQDELARMQQDHLAEMFKFMPLDSKLPTTSSRLTAFSGLPYEKDDVLRKAYPPPYSPYSHPFPPYPHFTHHYMPHHYPGYYGRSEPIKEQQQETETEKTVTEKTVTEKTVTEKPMIESNPSTTANYSPSDEDVKLFQKMMEIMSDKYKAKMKKNDDEVTTRMPDMEVTKVEMETKKPTREEKVKSP